MKFQKRQIAYTGKSLRKIACTGKHIFFVSYTGKHFLIVNYVFNNIFKNKINFVFCIRGIFRGIFSLFSPLF